MLSLRLSVRHLAGAVRYAHSDITVIGGNLIGATSAVALASSNAFKDKRISLVERRDIKFQQDPDQWTNRVYAITPGTKDFLIGTNVWQKLKPQHIHTCRKMFVWENYSNAALEFSGCDFLNIEGKVDKDTICYMIDQHTLLHAMYERLKELPNIDLQQHTRIGKVEIPTKDRRGPCDEKVRYEILGEDGHTETDLLVAADGFNSQIRKLMGVKNVSWSYKQKSVLAVVQLDDKHDVNGIAFQRFVPDGVVALLPLGNNQACLIWSLVDSVADLVLHLPDDAFIETLNEQLSADLDYSAAVMSVLNGTSVLMNCVGLKYTGRKLQPPKVVGVTASTKASYPLGMGHASNYVVPRVALVGDSAHRVHPLAGQGANFGFSDVECLVRHLETAAYRGEKLGDIGPLLSFERERQVALLPFQVAIEGLIHIYQNNYLPVVMARSLGVQVLDALPYLKQKIVQFAAR